MAAAIRAGADLLQGRFLGEPSATIETNKPRGRCGREPLSLEVVSPLVQT